MKYINKLFFLVVLFSLVNRVSYAVNSPTAVSKFYSCLKTLRNATNLNIANDMQQQMSACFMASEQSGINLSMDGLGEMSSSLYTMKLFTLIYREKSLVVNYDINRTELIEQPDQTGTLQRNGAQHYVTYVTKQYSKDGKNTTYIDVVFTLISNGLIVEMENSESAGYITPKINKDDLSIEQLRARAAYYYSRGMNDEAYNNYEKLVLKAPTDGDAAYRLALLTFWRKGCKGRFNRKQARNKAINYINIALQYGSDEIKNKARNVKANWENNNVYF